jgi:hypothetical protein
MRAFVSALKCPDIRHGLYPWNIVLCSYRIPLSADLPTGMLLQAGEAWFAA